MESFIWLLKLRHDTITLRYVLWLSNRTTRLQQVERDEAHTHTESTLVVAAGLFYKDTTNMFKFFTSNWVYLVSKIILA